MTTPALSSAAIDCLGHLLAKFNPELVKRINPKQHRVHKCPLFIKRNQRAKRARIKRIKQDRCRWPIAGIITREIIVGAPRHQCRPLRKAIAEQLAVMRFIQVMPRLNHRYKLNRD